MPLETSQSAPGNRINGPDGNDYDIVARVATDAGPYVILNHADAEGLAAGALVSEGDLRDHEDIAYVGTTAAAKAEAQKTRDDAEAAQIEEDRQARLERQKATAVGPDTTTGDTDTTGSQTS